MDSRVAPFARLLRLNAQLLRNCVDGLSEAQASSRVLPALNSIAFLVAHMTDARHTLLALLGGTAVNPLAPLFEGARGIDDVSSLPTLAELLEGWARVDEALDARLDAVSVAALEAPSPQAYPGGDRSVLGALAFLTQHDSYHIGQLALLRRALGLPAMRYGRAQPAKPSSSET